MADFWHWMDLSGSMSLCTMGERRIEGATRFTGWSGNSRESEIVEERTNL